MKPHLVAIPIPAEGHASPMMHLCGYLSKHHNFSITFVLLNDSLLEIDQILSKGSWPPSGTDITLVGLQGNSEILFPKKAVSDKKFDVALFHKYTALKHRNGLKEFLKQLRSVTCVLCDYQFGWAVEVASELDIPMAILCTGGITFSWFEFNMPWLVSSGNVPMNDPEDEIFEERDVLEEPVRLRRSDIPWHYWNDRPWQEYTITNNSKTFNTARWTLVSSCEELEPKMTQIMKDAVGNDKFLPVGPLFLLNESPENVGFSSFDPKCLQWLDEQATQSVVYIAFGSIAKFSLEELEEFGAGLVASKHRFLWVAKSSDDKQVMDFCARFREENKKQGLIVSWAPQAKVLPHSSVGAFLSHCGWNSTIEGISNGQVFLCWPRLFDQNLNRNLIVEHWKVGFSFRRNQGKVDGKEVERVIRLAMEGDEGKEARLRVKNLKVNMLKTTTCGSSHRNLQHFIQEINQLG